MTSKKGRKMKRLGKFFATLICGLACLATQAQTLVVAHRGYWKTEGSAQNSLTALRKAAEARVYGSEFDVLMTADGVAVVNHDDNIGPLDIVRTPFRDIKDHRLPNGETLPTLRAYLEEGKRLEGLQLILEIKPARDKAHEDRTVDSIVKMVKDLGLETRTEFISFSLNVCEQLVRATGGASDIYYLNGDLTPREAKEKGFTGIDYEHTVFRKHPEWVREAHDCGLKVNTWTVNRKKDLKRMYELGVDFITTDHPEEAARLVRKAR